MKLLGVTDGDPQFGKNTHARAWQEICDPPAEPENKTEEMGGGFADGTLGVPVASR
jgi:hypothetical protein